MRAHLPWQGTCIAAISCFEYSCTSAQVNGLLAKKEPWKLDDPAELASILSHSIEGLRKSAILLSPVIPTASQELLAGLGHIQAPSWADVQNDGTITGMRNILDSVEQHGARKAVFPRLKAVDALQP